jgi:hypothetical protein
MIKPKFKFKTNVNLSPLATKCGKLIGLHIITLQYRKYNGFIR